jgi:hypothetical protein
MNQTKKLLIETAATRTGHHPNKNLQRHSYTNLVCVMLVFCKNVCSSYTRHVSIFAILNIWLGGKVGDLAVHTTWDAYSRICLVRLRKTTKTFRETEPGNWQIQVLSSIAIWCAMFCVSGQKAEMPSIYTYNHKRQAKVFEENESSRPLAFEILIAHSSRSSLASHDVAFSSPTFLQLTDYKANSRRVCLLIADESYEYTGFRQFEPSTALLETIKEICHQWLGSWWDLTYFSHAANIQRRNGKVSQHETKTSTKQKIIRHLVWYLLPYISQVLLTCRSSRTFQRRTPSGWSPS